MTKFIAIFVSILMTNIPHIAWAQAADEMIPTSVVVEQMSRAQTREKIAGHLNRAEVRSELAKYGVSPEEAQLRIASLSDQELRQLASQMDQAMYGGEPVVGILIVVVLVLLIIFLVKRV
jgi:hypothetical protein